jgi:hypothetical protein
MPPQRSRPPFRIFAPGATAGDHPVPTLDEAGFAQPLVKRRKERIDITLHSRVQEPNHEHSLMLRAHRATADASPAMKFRCRILGPSLRLGA